MPAASKELIELLEVAHGYAILRSIMPLRTAVVECKASNDLWIEAARLIRAECPLGRKPSIEEYEVAIGRALVKVAP